MPEIREITVYTLAELSPKARKKAIEKEIEWLHEDFRAEELTEYFGELLADAGLPGLNPLWRLGYCKGDGVAFYGSVDLHALAKKDVEVREIVAWFDAHNVCYSAEIEGEQSHYHHWNSMSVEIEANGGEYEGDALREVAAQAINKTSEQLFEERRDKLADELREIIADLCREKSRELEKAGYDWIEDETSEERAIGQIEANDYRFEESGKLA